MKKLTIGIGLIALLGSSTALAADGHIYHLQQVGPSDRPTVMGASDRGIVFVGADHQLFRGFHHAQTAPDGVDQPFLWIDDIDDDNRVEFVGAGSPSFVVDDNADPMWGIGGGCEQFFFGNFIDDRNPEIFCRQERGVLVRSYDGQEYYAWEGRGFNISVCHMDDYDDDRRQEVACDLSSGNHMVFDLDYTEPEERDGAAPEPMGQTGVDTEAGLAIANGEESLSWNGQDVTLSFSGGAVTTSSGGAVVSTTQVGGTAIYSATTADLDGDGSEELYVGGGDQIFVIGADGTLVSTVEANPDGFTREPRVEIRSATANGLENSDRDVVRGQVEASLPSLVSCYDSAMGDDQFTRVGTMLWELEVDGDGEVGDTTRRHSDLRNSDLEGCISDAFEDMEFSGATSGSGTVSVTLRFDFVDVP